MITNIESRRMVVVSDLHVGNPFSGVKAKTVRFLGWAADNGYDICINGDGFEVTQVSLAKVTADAPEVLHALKSAVKQGVNIYYVVGNHDILFEHFLSDWGGFKLAPFLNIRSGSGRFRVEHGHLYDPFFVRFPMLYELSTKLAGLLLKLHPSLYKFWIGFEKARSRLRLWRKAEIIGEPASFLAAAEEIEARGFDGIVFGHTHHAGKVHLRGGGKYINPGSWMLSSSYVLLENGELQLREFPA